jgi:pimeloyl-ACP methyl ester carboxylesterase
MAMSSFVLVHGAWGGAHGFRHVRKLLQAAGHEVTTPCLTGIGERVHLAHPMVNLSTHVRDVVNHVLYEDLQDIVLLGFSYGGMVVTGALEHIAERVRHLVYLDAFVPRNGDSAGSLLRGAAPRQPIQLGEDWQLAGPVREFDRPEEAQWMAPRRTPQPKACFSEPVFLARPLEDHPFTRTYIKATAAPQSDPVNSAFWGAARQAQGSPAWQYFEVATNHMVANNRPQELAGLLQRIAGAA